MAGSTTKPSAARRGVRALWVGLVLIILGAVVVELAGRWVYGLGTGRQTVPDDKIEYLPTPSAEFRWIGHTARHNSFSMRSDEFPALRASADELRVMVMGDSIVNGGNHVDQDELATELLQRRLREKLNRPVIVGNIAAASWGPPNLLAYAERFGFFDADLVLIVVNNGDAWDVPTPIEERVKKEPAPRWAIVDLFQELSDRFAPADPSQRDNKRTPENATIAIEALRQLVRSAQESGAEVALVLHAEGRELATGPREGTLMIRHAFEGNGIMLIDTADAYRAASADSASLFHTDLVHLTPAGQEVLANELYATATQLFEQRSNAQHRAAE